MSHAFAGPFEEADWVVQRRPLEEAEIHMGLESVDIAKGGILNAGSGTAIVQQLANVRATIAHALEPWLGHPTRRVSGGGEPGVDAGVAPHGAGEPHQLFHRGILARELTMSRLPRPGPR